MTTLEKIAAIRRLMNEVAGAPEVLALAGSGTHHPDLRIGDCIEAFDDLVYGGSVTVAVTRGKVGGKVLLHKSFSLSFTC